MSNENNGKTKLLLVALSKTQIEKTYLGYMAIILVILITIFACLNAFFIGYLVTPLLIDKQVVRADILSALGTWLGSIGTIGTLVFLSVQYRNERKARGDQEKKQEEMWAEKKQMLNFEKLQTHKVLFNDLLISLESDSELKPITIANKNTLYYKIFPTNDFLSLKHDLTEYKITLFDSLDQHFKYYFDILQNISHRKNLSKMESLLFHIDSICDNLNVSFKIDNAIVIGNLIHEGKDNNNFLYMNVLRPWAYFESLLSVYNSLRRFACLEPKAFPMHDVGPGSNTSHALIDNFMSNDSYKLISHYNILSIFTYIYQYMLSDEYEPLHETATSSMVKFSNNKFRDLYNIKEAKEIHLFLNGLSDKLDKIKQKTPTLVKVSKMVENQLLEIRKERFT